MKNVMRIFFSLLFCLITLTLFAVNTVEVESKISHVIVYPEWAYVTREVQVNLAAGVTKLLYKNLPAWIDPESIQVKVSNTSDNRIVGTGAKSIFLKQITEGEVADVKQRVTELRDTMEDLYTELYALDTELDNLKKMSSWKLDKVPFEKAARKVDVAELREFDAFFNGRYLEIQNKRNTLNRRIRDLNPEITVWERKWNELERKANLEKKEITISIEASKQNNATLFVRYLISGASWYPVYDARTDLDVKNVDVVYNAVIHQSTGEDWTDSKIKLSTIKPHLIREKPDLNPWYINSASDVNTISQTNEFFRGKNELYSSNLNAIQEKMTNQIIMDNDLEIQQAFENYSTNKAKALDVIRQAEERGTTVEFDITGLFTVKTDGKAVKVPVGTAAFDTDKSYSIIPSVSKSTYVICTVKNTSKFPFLPGIVQVYKAGNFIGKSKINFVSQKEKFDLFMGLEERIKMSKELNTKKSSSSFFGNRKNLRVSYNILVQNFMTEPVNIIVTEQIPVSQDNAIKVKLTDIEPRVDKIDKGIINWEINLASQAKQILNFGFEIDYPEDIYLENADELEKQLQQMY